MSIAPVPTFAAASTLTADQLNVLVSSVNYLNTSVDGANATAGQALSLLPGINVKNTIYGAKGDNSTDDTAAIQAAINAAQSTATSLGQPLAAVYLPAGKYKISASLNVTRPVVIFGDGSAASWIVMAAGMTSAAIKMRVAHDGTDYPAGGAPAAQVVIEGLRIVGTSLTDVPGRGVAHGIDWTSVGVTNTVNTRLLLDDVAVNGVPGDCFRFVSINGWFEATRCYAQYPYGTPVYLNSVTDCRWRGGEICGGNVGGVVFGNAALLLTGCVAFQMEQCNIYVSGSEGVHAYGITSAVLRDCYIDLSASHGVTANLTAGGKISLPGTTIRWSSQKTNGTYSDLYCPTSRVGIVNLANARFEAAANNTYSSNNPLYNIQFAASNSTAVFLSNTEFLAGSLVTSGVCSDATKCTFDGGSIKMFGTIIQRQAGGTYCSLDADFFTAVPPSTNGGIRVNALDGTAVAALQSTTSGKVGMLTLYDSGGTASLQLGNYGSITQLLKLSGPYASDAAAATGGVPVNGAYNKTGGSVAWRVS
jgi:hypothetical protein